MSLLSVNDIASNVINETKSSEEEILLFCRNVETKEKVTVHVRNIPHVFYAQVPAKFRDSDGIMNYLNENTWVSSKCNRTDCCSNVVEILPWDGEDEEEEGEEEEKGEMEFIQTIPCGKVLALDPKAYVKKVELFKNEKLPFVGAYSFKDKDICFACITVTRAFHMNAVSRCMQKLLKTMPGAVEMEIGEVRPDTVQSFLYSSGGVCQNSKIRIHNSALKDGHITCSMRNIELIPMSVFDPSPLDICAFDIETFTSTRGMPNPQKQAVQMISLCFPGDEMYSLSYGTPFPPGFKTEVNGKHCTVLMFQSEPELLMGFVMLLRKKDPDVILGWNSNQFDWFFIFNRCRVLGIYDTFRAKLSRIKNYHCISLLNYKEIKGRTVKCGEFRVPGLVMFDLMTYLMGKPGKQLPSYKLKKVCEAVLPAHLSKTDFDIKEGNAAFTSTDDVVRWHYMTYNVMDSVSVLELNTVYNAVNSFSAQSFVFKSYISLLFGAGQQARTISLIQQQCKVDNIVMPKHEIINIPGAGKDQKGASYQEIPLLNHFPKYVEHLEKDVVGTFNEKTGKYEGLLSISGS
jgi:hypothetical protein